MASFADEWKSRCAKRKRQEEQYEEPKEESTQEIVEEDTGPRFDIYKRTLPGFRNLPVMFGLSLEQAVGMSELLNDREQEKRRANPMYSDVVFYDAVPQNKPEEKSLFFNCRPVMLGDAA